MGTQKPCPKSEMENTDIATLLKNRIRNLNKKCRRFDEKLNSESKEEEKRSLRSQIQALEKLEETLPAAVDEEINLVVETNAVSSSSSGPVLKCIATLLETYPENSSVREELETLVPRIVSAVQRKCAIALQQIKQANLLTVPISAQFKLNLFTSIGSYKQVPMYSGSITQYGRTPIRISALPPTVNTNIETCKDDYKHSRMISCYGTIDGEKKMIAVDHVVHINDYFKTMYQTFTKKGLEGTSTTKWWEYIKSPMILIFRQLAEMVTWFLWKDVTFLDLMDGVFVQRGVEPSLKFLPGRSIFEAQKVSAKVVEMQQSVEDFSYGIVQIVGLYGTESKKCKPDMTSIRRHITQELCQDGPLCAFMHNISDIKYLDHTMLSGALFINPPLLWESGFSFNLLTNLQPRMKENLIDMSRFQDLMYSSKLISWKEGIIARHEKYPVMRISKFIAGYHKYLFPEHIFNFCCAIAHHMNDEDSKDGKRPVLKQKLSDEDIVLLLQNLIPGLLTETHHHLLKYFRTLGEAENDRKVFSSLMGGEIKREVDREAENSARLRKLSKVV